MSAPVPHSLSFASLNSAKDNQPKSKTSTWSELAHRLTRHEVKERKGGAAWSPAVYPQGVTRGNANVESVSLLVLDFDDGTPPDAFIENWTAAGLAFCIHSSFSSTTAKPKWRAVFPLAEPVPAAQWPEAYRRMSAALGDGVTDPACKDAARLYFLPTHPPGVVPFSHLQLEGRALEWERFPDPDPQDLADTYSRFARRSAPVGGGTGHGKPGEDFNTRATVDDVLAALFKAGWQEHSRKGHAVYLTRPGKSIREGLSAIVGAPNDPAPVFTCFTSSAPPFDAGKAYAPFGVIGLLEHGGNFAEAAKTLGAQGFGEPLEAKKAVREARKATPAKPAKAQPKRSLGDFHNTDGGNADRLVYLFGEDLRYVPGLGWRVWTGARWEAGDELAQRRARDVVRALYGYAEELAGDARQEIDPEKRKLLGAQITEAVSFANKSESAPRIAAIVTLAKSDAAITADASEFDLKPWRVAFPNGTWDRGEWREHRRGDFIEALTAVPYEPKANRSDWYALLERMTGGDEDLALMLQDVAGYALSGASSMRLLPWLYGPKGTGKSTFVELLQTVLGPCGKPIDWALLSGDKEGEKLGAAVRNMRAVFLPEAGRKRLDADLLKMLSGGDRLPGRNLYQTSTYTVTPTWALMAVSNDPPNMNAYDDALRDRLRALPFLHPLSEGGRLTFTRGEKLETYRRRTDTPLIAGFTAWAVEGLERIYRAQDVHQAKASIRHTRQFWTDADPLTPFWEQIEDGERRLKEGIRAGELRSMYLAWCEQEGIRKPLAAGTPWGDACRAKGLIKRMLSRGPDKGREVWEIADGGLFSQEETSNGRRVDGSGAFSENSLTKGEYREVLEKNGLPVYPSTPDTPEELEEVPL